MLSRRKRLFEKSGDRPCFEFCVEYKGTADFMTSYFMVPNREGSVSNTCDLHQFSVDLAAVSWHRRRTTL